MSEMEVNDMPGRDGTGPLGVSAMAGRGMGFCAGGVPERGVGRGLGLGWRRGCGRGFGRQFVPATLPDGVSPKDLLAQQKRTLESRLEMVNKQLETL